MEIDEIDIKKEKENTLIKLLPQYITNSFTVAKVGNQHKKY